MGDPHEQAGCGPALTELTVQQTDKREEETVKQCTGVLGLAGTEIWYIPLHISLKQTQWYLSEKVREEKKKIGKAILSYLGHRG